MSDLYGLIGERLGHSISPQIHSKIFKELNLDGCYHLFEVERDKLKDAVYGLNAIRAKGVNVTIPYKTDIMGYLDEISAEALDIGAVNTIHFDRGRAIGYNTDYMGFGMMLKRNDIEVKDKKFVILGTGGSSKSVLKYLLKNGCKGVKLVSRDLKKYGKSTNDIQVISYEEVKHLSQEDTIINCTPCGMAPNINISPVDKDTIGKFSAAVDLIYNPRQTLFLKYAEELNLKGVNGLYMLIGQAVSAQEIWNKRELGLNFVDKIFECFV